MYLTTYRNIWPWGLEKLLDFSFGSFWKYTYLKVGDGPKVKFWHDSWIGGGPLVIRFPRMFSLSVHKEASVCDFCIKDSGSGNSLGD